MEITTTILGLELLQTERQNIRKMSIALDNTTVIKASTLRSSTSEHYLTDMFHQQLEQLIPAYTSPCTGCQVMMMSQATKTQMQQPRRPQPAARPHPHSSPYHFATPC